MSEISNTTARPEGAPRRRGIGCLVLMMMGLGLLALIGVGLAMVSGGDADELVETFVEGDVSAVKKLALIDVRGVLMQGGGGLAGQPGVTNDALRMLDRARKDERVAGVLLRIDTPGGSVTDADLLHDRIRRLHDAGKPVVVLMGDLCASGGYYMAVAADEIWALPTTVTGSIGVVIHHLNVAELLARYGVQDGSIVSGPNKALLSPTRPQSAAHVALLQGIVDAMYDRFVKLVAEGRGLDEVAVRAVADGRLLTADQALEHKLIDGIGYRRDVIAALKKRVDGGPFKVVRYGRVPSMFDLLRARLTAPSPTAEVMGAALGGPRVMVIVPSALGR